MYVGLDDQIVLFLVLDLEPMGSESSTEEEEEEEELEEDRSGVEEEKTGRFAVLI